MKSLFAIVLLVAITSSVLSPSIAHAVPYMAQVEFDFNEGWIRITPPEYRVGEPDASGARLEGTYKSSGFGISFDFFKMTSTVADLSSDSYLFLSGTPDQVSFRLVQFLCIDGNPTPYGLFTSEWTLAVMKGNIQVKSHFWQDDPRRDLMNLKGVCTEEYRMQLAQFGFRGLSKVRGDFTQTASNGQLLIQWDAKNWQDALARRANTTIERIDRLLQNKK